VYLSRVADAVIAHRAPWTNISGLLMAFWGAPLGNDQHVLPASAALDAQRAIHALNQAPRENAAASRNLERRAAGLPPKPPLRALQWAPASTPAR